MKRFFTVWRFATTEVKDSVGNNVLSQNYQRSLTGSLQTKTTGSGVWNYGYDLTDQLTNAVLSAGSAALRDTSYSYDAMGNRLFNRESTQGTQKETAYEPNNLNQYDVTISTNLTTSTGSTNNLLYDLNGNLTNDGVRAYSWDTRNELIAVQDVEPVEGSKRVEFAYDYMGRRISKDVYVWQGSGFTNQASHIFFYDGWNLVKEIELNPQSEIVNQKSYVWGNDLSGSLQGAGGVGGLLCSVRSQSGSSPQAFFYTYDHNGNVEKVVRGSGAVIASFQYDAFGNTIQESIAQGLKSKDFPVRFSTKYFDAETGLAYYGYRYYSPEKGRWINRDPIEEDGGLALYAFVRNNPASWFDYLGWVDCEWYVGTCARSLAGHYITIPNNIRGVGIPDFIRERVEKAINDDIGHHDVGFLIKDSDGNTRTDYAIGFFAVDFNQAAIGAAKELLSYNNPLHFLWKNAGWVPGVVRESPNPSPRCSMNKELSEQEYNSLKNKAYSLRGSRQYNLLHYNCQAFATQFIGGGL